VVGSSLTRGRSAIWKEGNARRGRRAYKENRPVLDIALEDSGLDAATLKNLLHPMALTQGGIQG